MIDKLGSVFTNDARAFREAIFSGTICLERMPHETSNARQFFKMIEESLPHFAMEYGIDI